MGVDITEIGPQAAWDMLANNASAQLVDVRTRAEWSFVGLPNLAALDRQVILVEWKSFPTMSANDAFITELRAALGDTPASQLLFICRSGARSHDAARRVAAEFSQSGATPVCINVAEGFEGDLNTTAQRGHINGWKAAGLPWRQS